MDKQLDSIEIAKRLREYKRLCGGSNAAIVRDWHLQLCEDAADLIESLQAQLTTAYMDGVKKAVYEIMKEADIPGSQEIRDSGDTDDVMCTKVAERIKAYLTDKKLLHVIGNDLVRTYDGSALDRADQYIEQLEKQLTESRARERAAVEDMKHLIFKCADSPEDFCGEVCANNNGICQKGVAAGYSDKCGGFEWRGPGEGETE
jgi:HPt (histidine-containing phosphotransfer) domain-containing protein